MSLNEKEISILDNLSVASPCPVSWDAMELTDDDRQKFCNQCNKNVYDISGMTKSEAEDLLANASGRLCISFYQRSDGKVMTENCPAVLRALRNRYKKVAKAITGLICTLFSLNSANAQSTQPIPIMRTMGEACVVPPPQKTYYDKSNYAVKNLNKLKNLSNVWIKDAKTKLVRGSIRVTVTPSGSVSDCVIISTTGDTKVDSILVKEIKKTKLSKFTPKNTKQNRKYLLLEFSANKK